MRIVLALLIGIACLPRTAAADEALLPDGRRLTGALRWQEGRPVFVAGDRSLKLDLILHVRSPERDTPPLPAAARHRVLFRGGQRITGELLDLDAEQLRFRPAWSETPLTIRRPFVMEVALLTAPERRPAREVAQDDVWLATGDQLFGRVLRADPKAVEIEGRFGKRTLSWDELHGLALRTVASTPHRTEGEHVRLRVDNDEVEGVLRGLDEHRLTLLHAAGELVIPRERVRRLQGTFHGRRLELDDGLHHLGRETLPALAVPRPEGLSLRLRFVLDVVPQETHLVVVVAHLKGPADGKAVEDALERGVLRTEVLLNDRVVDYLNRQAGRASAEPRRLSLDLPRRLLKVGENVLDIRQTLDGETGRYADCLISGVVVEIPRP